MTGYIQQSIPHFVSEQLESEYHEEAQDIQKDDFFSVQVSFLLMSSECQLIGKFYQHCQSILTHGLQMAPSCDGASYLGCAQRTAVLGRTYRSPSWAAFANANNLDKEWN